MDVTKDYYSILGVSRNAEPIVIRAAYRALAQFYHPDKFDGPIDKAQEYMSLINEAYSVLGDSVLRETYDEQRRRTGKGAGDIPEDSDYSFNDLNLHSAWITATEYFPDLLRLESELAKLSRKLAFVYKSYLVQEKRFKERIDIAKAMEEDFLQTYFGTNPDIIAFARSLVAAGNKEAAKDLNRAVSVLGNDVSAHLIIERITNKHDVELDESECVRRLAILGYKAKKFAGEWRIKEPLGGVERLSTLEDLRRYYVARAISLHKGR